MNSMQAYIAFTLPFSQGEGGSDVGALIGALTGVISTLFGVSASLLGSFSTHCFSLVARRPGH